MANLRTIPLLFLMVILTGCLPGRWIHSKFVGSDGTSSFSEKEDNFIVNIKFPESRGGGVSRNIFDWRLDNEIHCGYASVRGQQSNQYIIKRFACSANGMEPVISGRDRHYMYREELPEGATPRCYIMSQNVKEGVCFVEISNHEDQVIYKKTLPTKRKIEKKKWEWFAYFLD